MTYVQWIEDYLERNPHPLGACIRATEAMKAAFPELTIVRGHVYCPAPWGKRGHRWLTDPAGEIVDPTAAQFPEILEYEPWKPGDEVRCGTCMNCGMAIWKAVATLDENHDACVCSDACEDVLRAEYNAARRT